MFGIKLGTAAAAGLTVASAGTIIDQDTLIPLGGVIAGALLIARYAWKIATVHNDTVRRLESLEQKIKQLDRRRDSDAGGGRSGE